MTSIASRTNSSIDASSDTSTRCAECSAGRSRLERTCSTRSTSRSARLRVAPSDSNTVAHPLPIPWAAPTMSARFPSRRKALLDSATSCHSPPLREYTVGEDGNGVGEIDHGTDVIRNDRDPLADAHFGTRGQLHQPMLFAEPCHACARVAGNRPEGRARVAHDQPVGREHLRSSIDHRTGCLWPAHHGGYDERGDIGLRCGALEDLAEIVEDIRSG